MAKTRFTRILVLGTSADDTLTSSAAGSAIEEFYQGSAGNDTITSGRGKDTFIFESNYAGNGTDTITDFQVRQVDPNGEYDILDLSKAIGKRIYISSDNISNYVWVEGGKLYVDPQGQKTASTPWAILNGVEAGDQLRVRTGSFDGWITATAKAGPPDYDTIVVGQDANGNPLYWGDVDEDGIYDQGSDVDLAVDGTTGKLSDAMGDIDYTAKAWNVVFQAINVGEPVIDLTGFDLLDKLTIDFKQLKWMAVQDSNFPAASLGAPKSGAISLGAERASYDAVNNTLIWYGYNEWKLKGSTATAGGNRTVSLAVSRVRTKLCFSAYVYPTIGATGELEGVMAKGLLTAVFQENHNKITYPLTGAFNVVRPAGVVEVIWPAGITP